MDSMMALEGTLMSSPAARMAYRTRQAEFRQRLAAARLRLARTVAATAGELQALARGESREIAEDAAADALGAILERLEGRERHELDEIDAAQARLEAGLFGVCERCHQAIPLARLRAMPAARHCAICRVHHEAAH
ncbi:MAG TPA: TraR/DksA C4-type zinc finger protein [Methylomirabilota bacterium]|nr:TraR/DksA C4-type zinc finger protein [Methylomirabilota bacterium]